MRRNIEVAPGDRLKRQVTSEYLSRLGALDGRQRQALASTITPECQELYGPLASRPRRVIEGYWEVKLATLTDFIRNMRSVLASTANPAQGNLFQPQRTRLDASFGTGRDRRG